VIIPRAILASQEAFRAELSRLNAEARGAIKTEKNGHQWIVGALMPPLWAERYDKLVSAGRKLGYVS
jgi:hypothetical protein